MLPQEKATKGDSALLGPAQADSLGSETPRSSWPGRANRTFLRDLYKASRASLLVPVPGGQAHPAAPGHSVLVLFILLINMEGCAEGEL